MSRAAGSCPLNRLLRSACVALCLASLACEPGRHYSVVLRHATIYDGSGGTPFSGDLAIAGDTIAAIGDVGRATIDQEIDATGLAVAPGFVNMLSWANESLIADGRSMSDILQGVTLEVMGEGDSDGAAGTTR